MAQDAGDESTHRGKK